MSSQPSPKYDKYVLYLLQKLPLIDKIHYFYPNLQPPRTKPIADRLYKRITPHIDGLKAARTYDSLELSEEIAAWDRASVKSGRRSQSVIGISSRTYCQYSFAKKVCSQLLFAACMLLYCLLIFLSPSPFYGKLPLVCLSFRASCCYLLRNKCASCVWTQASMWVSRRRHHQCHPLPDSMCNLPASALPYVISARHLDL